ncbi:MAG: D-arabinono-1,4-lactone oxidase [Bacteroidota bacterium]
MKIDALLSEFNQINLIADEEKAVDALASKFQELELEDESELPEELDGIPEHGDFEIEKKSFPELEFDTEAPVMVDNPTSTWSFKGLNTIIYPHSLRGTVNAVKYAESKNRKIRGLGTRNSFSLAIQTDDIYINLDKTYDYSIDKHNEKVAALDTRPMDRLMDGLDKGKYFHTPAGMKIAMINHILCPDNDDDIRRFGSKRMFNMAGVDLQTIAGGISTGTHGTGGKYSTWHDTIRSIEIVTGEGRVFRYEASDHKITDPAKHQAYYDANPQEVPVTLVQDDDDKFHALLVSMGCFGIIYSVIMEVADMTLLHQQGEYSRFGWDQSMKDSFKHPILPVNVDDEFFYSIQVNPYRIKPDQPPSTLIKSTVPTNVEGKGRKVNKRKFWPSVFANSKMITKFLRRIANSGDFPKRRLVESALKTQNDNMKKGKGYTDLAYKIWNGGIGQLKAFGTAIEFAFPSEQIPDIMDLLLAMMEQVGERGKGYYLNAPITLRFSRPSKALLANNYHLDKDGNEVKEWCHLEVIRVNAADKKADMKELEIYTHLQTFLLLKGGRPHWGLNFDMDFTVKRLRELYPSFDRWHAAYKFFNNTGVFENKFSREAGLDD